MAISLACTYYLKGEPMTTTELTQTELIAWLRDQNWSDFAQSLARDADRRGHLTERQDASARKMYAKVAARMADRAAAAAVATGPSVADNGDALAEGYYLVDGWLWKIKRSGRGNLYAMTRGEHGGWEYVRGGMRQLNGAHPVTPAEAVAHGHATGRCLFCDAELDDREGLGVLVGVGPVCSREHLGMTQRQLAAHMGIAL